MKKRMTVLFTFAAVFVLAFCIHSAAADENGEELYSRGNAYFFGDGVEQDYAKAEECYRRAAELGSVVAQNDLGFLYMNGYGVEQDYAKAAECFRRAAELGHAEAQNGLGFLYLNGYGVETDYAKAAEYFRRASDNGYGLGSFNLGYMYEQGLGTEQSFETAADFYRVALEQGWQQAQERYDFCIAAAEEQKQTAAAGAKEGGNTRFNVRGDFRFIEYSDGTAVLQQYIGSTEAVTIPAYDGAYRVTAIAPFAFYDENGRVDSVTCITVESGIEQISPYAFAGCHELREVFLPETVKSIGTCAFKFCRHMEKLYLPDSMESYGGLRSVFDAEVPENLEVHGGANVTEPRSGSSDNINEIPADPDGFVIEGNVLRKYIGNAERVTIPGEVTVIGPEAFINNKMLRSVFIHEGVTEIGNYAFAGCNNLEEISLPDGLRIIGKYAFEKCFSLVSFMIPDSVYLVGNYALKECRNLETVDLGRGVTGIMYYTPLDDCNALKKVIARDNLVYLMQGALNSSKAKPVIYGINGSVAYQYAKDNDLTFVSLEETATRASVKVEKTSYGQDQCVTTGGFSFWLPDCAARIESDGTVYCWEMDGNTPKAYMKFLSSYIGVSGREFNSSYNSGEDDMRRILRNMGVPDSVLIVSHPVEAPSCESQRYSRTQTIDGKALKTTEKLYSFYDVNSGYLTYVYWSYREDADYYYTKEFEAVVASREYLNQGKYSRETRELLDQFTETYRKAGEILSSNSEDPETIREAYQIYSELYELSKRVGQIGDYMLDAETYNYYHQVKNAVETDLALTLTQLSMKLGMEIGDYLSR